MDINEIAKKSLIKGVKLGAETAATYIDDIFVIKKTRKAVKRLVKYIKKAEIQVDIQDDKVHLTEEHTVVQDDSVESIEGCAHCGAFTSSFYKYCPNCGSLILRRVTDEA